ncbi:uncharacterized protein LOC141854993 [Brevipalpus obovatus]|uniref:uncharacterized protein LOC141854993 n=1 Tax=Brevipalpus obovatus TaxID=246614 RepID=UPI003D9EDE53
MASIEPGDSHKVEDSESGIDPIDEAQNLSILFASNELVIFKSLSRVFNRPKSRQILQRLVFFCGSFTVIHSLLMLTSFLSYTGLEDVFDFSLENMRYGLILNDASVFYLLNYILRKPSDRDVLDMVLDRLYANNNINQSTFNTGQEPLSGRLIRDAARIRKWLYTLIFMIFALHGQYVMSLALNHLDGMLQITFLLDCGHILIELFETILLVVLLNQFIVVTIFVRRIFGNIGQKIKTTQNKPINPVQNGDIIVNQEVRNELRSFESDAESTVRPASNSTILTSASMAEGQMVKISSELLRKLRNEFCAAIELTKKANKYWKHFLLVFIAIHFLAMIFQAHYLLNKRLVTGQMFHLGYRWIFNFISIYILLKNSSPVPKLVTNVYDDLYPLTLGEASQDLRDEAWLFLDRIAYGKIGFTLGDFVLITPNFLLITVVTFWVAILIFPSMM